jgi:hypothetical protein
MTTLLELNDGSFEECGKPPDCGRLDRKRRSGSAFSQGRGGFAATWNAMPPDAEATP